MNGYYRGRGGRGPDPLIRVPYSSRGVLRPRLSASGPGGVDEGASAGVSNLCPARTGTSALGISWPELADRRGGAAGAAGRTGRLAVPPRCLRPPGPPPRAGGGGPVGGFQAGASSADRAVRRPGHRAADRTALAWAP